MKQVLDNNFITNKESTLRRQLFKEEIRKLFLLSFALIIYVIVINLIFLKVVDISLITSHASLNAILVLSRALLIYPVVSCVFGVFIATFQYKGFSFYQRFIRASIVSFSNILLVISIIISLLSISVFFVK